MKPRFLSLATGKSTNKAPASGLFIRYGFFLTPKPICTVVVHIGKSQWIEQYAELARDLQPHGINLIIHEWLGQGESYRWIDPKAKNATDSPDDMVLVDGYRAFQESKVFEQLNTHPLTGKQLPVIHLCHSNGAKLKMLDVVMRGGSNEPHLLLSPFMGLYGMPRWMDLPLLCLSWALANKAMETHYVAPARLLKKRHTVTESFENNRATSDHRRFTVPRRRLRAHPRRQTGPANYRWSYNSFLSMYKIRKAGRKARREGINLFPHAMMLGAGGDRIVNDAEDIARLLNIPFQRIDGAKHELLSERDELREPVVRTIMEFIFHELRRMQRPAVPHALAPNAGCCRITK